MSIWIGVCRPCIMLTTSLDKMDIILGLEKKVFQKRMKPLVSEFITFHNVPLTEPENQSWKSFNCAHLVFFGGLTRLQYCVMLLWWIATPHSQEVCFTFTGRYPLRTRWFQGWTLRWGSSIIKNTARLLLKWIKPEILSYTCWSRVQLFNPSTMVKFWWCVPNEFWKVAHFKLHLLWVCTINGE